MDKTMMTFAMKRTTKLGCWNVRSLRQVGRLKQVCAEMINYDLDILGLSEVRYLCANQVAHFPFKC